MTTEPPTVLYGVRCSDPGHRLNYNVVHATSASEERMRSLAAGERCAEVVRSTDDGETWVRAEQ